MNSKEITDSVINYINDENAKYAILIDGAWGSGKTYLYEHHIKNKIAPIEYGKNEPKKNVYISLYGISSIETLSKQLIVNYLIYVKGNESEIIKKGLKPVSGIISMACNAITISVGQISAKFDDAFERIENIISVKDMVICFDDLERCTIPINEFFGFVNNLVEHCYCKVIILADENNIGKIYANTNIEEKYMTVLMGNRKVIKENKKDSKTEAKNNNGEISIDELKKFNEILYSENYVYKDIKEKVIGKTMYYFPLLKDIIIEIINGNEEGKGIIQDEEYIKFINNHIDSITNIFDEIRNRNFRIIKTWILSFRKIYSVTTKNYSENEYYEFIMEEFIHYSIWVIGSIKKNEKITMVSNYRNQEFVYYEGHEYTQIMRYRFIDAWVRRDVWDDKDFFTACKEIINRKETEKRNCFATIPSTGTSLNHLRDWRFLDDEKIAELLTQLEKELANNEYVYTDYADIIILLMFFQENKLYNGNLDSIRDTMINLIKNDSNTYEEDYFPKMLPTEDMREKFKKIYSPIAEKRKERNRELNKLDHEEADIYENAESFFDYCSKMETFYCSHKSFLEYINIEKMLHLIEKSDNQGIYTICKVFSKIYYMENIREIYCADIEGLIMIRKTIIEEEEKVGIGITRKIALDYLAELIKGKLMLLGAEKEKI